MNDQNLLKRIEIETSVAEPYFFDRLDIKSFKKELAKLEKKAKKEGYKEISVSVGLDKDVDYDQSYLNVSGIRLETELEWYTRLERIKNHNSSILREATRLMSASKKYTDENDEINYALSKSSLKCEICKKPTNVTISGFKNNGKERRICNECILKEEKT